MVFVTYCHCLRHSFVIIILFTRWLVDLEFCDQGTQLVLVLSLGLGVGGVNKVAHYT